MSFQLIELEIADGIATLRLNRPEKRNAMSDEMREVFALAEKTKTETEGSVSYTHLTLPTKRIV